MTDMKRITISMPEDMDKAIVKLRKTKTFERASYTEVIRHLISIGLESWKKP